MPGMDNCKHKHLVLLPQQSSRLRCVHCHLTIKADELEDGYCPECFEAKKQKYYDFEEVKSSHNAATIYRCESCGIMIECN
uniref:RNHCP domain-containing protein n=2 Tax=Desulfobacterium TaxID=2295 RepID=E1YAF1_9BACT|nr:unknown protein [uncultured Desulfobacterium sp.]